MQALHLLLPENITPLVFQNIICNPFCKTEWICNFEAWVFLPHPSFYFPNTNPLWNSHYPQRTNQMAMMAWYCSKQRNIQYIHMLHLWSLTVPQQLFCFTESHYIFVKFCIIMWSRIVTLDNWSKLLKRNTITHQFTNNRKYTLFKEHLQSKHWILWCDIIWTRYITINIMDASFIFNNDTILTNKLYLSNSGTFRYVEKGLFALPPFYKTPPKSISTIAIPTAFEIWYLWYPLTISGFIPSNLLAVLSSSIPQHNFSPKWLHKHSPLPLPQLFNTIFEKFKWFFSG